MRTSPHLPLSVAALFAATTVFAVVQQEPQPAPAPVGAGPPG